MPPGFPAETKKPKVIFVIGTLNTTAALVAHFSSVAHTEGPIRLFMHFTLKERTRQVIQT